MLKWKTESCVTWVNLNCNICKNLTGVVDAFLASWLGQINLVMVLLRILKLVSNVMLVFNTIYGKIGFMYI